MSTPTSLMVAIWSLRSVPISMLILMFVFNSGSLQFPQTSVDFWFDAIAIAGLMGIIAYWNHLKRLHWNAGFTIYQYIFLVLILRNPYGILTSVPEGKLTAVDLQPILHSLWVGIGIFVIAILLEVLIFQLRQFKIWAWWVALSISFLYVSSIIFFFSGTLGIWSLLDSETKQLFKRHLRYRKN